MQNSPMEIIFSNALNVIDAEGIERRLRKGKKLRIKLGVDPTRPDLTLGHMVVFNKLRQFQDLGHEAVFLIGDFTTTIGDPSGRSETRPLLTEKQIEENAQTYLEQAFRILDPRRTEVRRNSEWFGKMLLADMLTLAREITVAQLIERDDFATRYEKHIPISLVEFLYPLIQGYDSVQLHSDVELGGNDQLFNMLVGRVLQSNRGQDPQAVITMPLLVGLDGQRKMSKSYNNFIAFNENAQEMFGKIMSIPDETMWIYYQLLLCKSPEEITELKSLHPLQAKKILAQILVEHFHGKEFAQKELTQFEQVFSRHEFPDEMVTIDLEKAFGVTAMDLLEVLAAMAQFSSKKEIRRLWEQGAIRINGEKVESANPPQMQSGSNQVIQVGKRQFFKIL